MKVKVQSLDAKAKAGDIELDDAVFGVEPRADILHRVVTWQLEKRRAPPAPPASAATSTAPARSSAARRAAAPPVTAIAARRSSSAAARRTAPAPATSIRR